MSEIKHIVYSLEVEETSFIKRKKEEGFMCIPVLDVRSAIYVATGICAQNHEPVIVCTDSGNSSRSVFSGMTEAYYRRLPIILITFGMGLDYSQELADVVIDHYKISEENQIAELLKREGPMHIEFLIDGKGNQRFECRKIQNVLSILMSSDMYLYIGQGIENVNNEYKCRCVYGGLPNCYDGALANVLGASLAKKKARYVGLISETEFLHDMNTLGNINVNDLLLYIVVAKKKNEIILDYARNLSFEAVAVAESVVNNESIKDILHNGKKSLLMIYKED